jgi:hypothetical protein
LIPNISAISLAVKNFFPFTITPYISVIIQKHLIVVKDYNLLNKRIAKKRENLEKSSLKLQIIIDYIVVRDYNIYR